MPGSTNGSCHKPMVQGIEIPLEIRGDDARTMWSVKPAFVANCLLLMCRSISLAMMIAPLGLVDEDLDITKQRLQVDSSSRCSRNQGRDCTRYSLVQSRAKLSCRERFASDGVGAIRDGRSY